MLTSSKRRFEELDALRGIAALTVVLWHGVFLWLPATARGAQAHIMREALARHSPGMLGALGWPTLLVMSPLRIFIGGYEAVVLFFVLSGFVLSLSFWAGKPALYRSFLTRRVFRIYVPYLGALGLAVAGNYFLSTGGIQGLNNWFNSTWTLPISLDTLLGHIGLIGIYDYGVFNTAFWSLLHEMRVSIIFPLVLMALKPAGRIGWMLALLLILLGGCLSDRFPLGQFLKSIEVLGFFILGACVARWRNPIIDLYRSRETVPRRVSCIIALLLFSFGWIWTFPMYAIGWSIMSKDIFIAIGAAGLIAVSFSSPRISRLLTGSIPMALGKISYSVYLMHTTILWGLVYILYPRMLPSLIFPLYLVATALLAPVFWKYVEAPANKAGHRVARRISGARLRLAATE